jgi:hypothetical protein
MGLFRFLSRMILTILVCLPLFGFSQDGVVLVIPDSDAKISVDGVDIGSAVSGSAFRITTAPGEHYVEAMTTIDGVSKVKGQVVTVVGNGQQIIKLTFHEVRSTAGSEESVADLNFNLPGTIAVMAWRSSNKDQPFPYPEFYYAFEQGDEITIDVSMSNRNGTNELNISTYPDNVVRFSNKAFVDLRNVKFRVPSRSIYKFTFATNHAFDRNCFFKISRKATSLKPFNTSVVKKLIFTTVPLHEPQNFFVNSGGNATWFGGNSRVSIDVKLPLNTFEWFYRYSAYRDPAQVAYVKESFKLFAELTTLTFDLSGTSAGVASIAADKLSDPPGSDYCEIFLLSPNHLQAFLNKTDDQWTYITTGSRLNFKSGNVRVDGNGGSEFCLGIRNPAPTQGINVTVEVVAVTAAERYVMEHVD